MLFRSFLKNLFIFIYFHDIGKLTAQFQENIKKGRSSQNYPHAVYSFYLLENFILDELYHDSLLSFPFESLSVLAHHTQLHNGIYENHNNIYKADFKEKEIYNFLKDINRIYTLYSFKDFFDFNKIELEKFNKPLNFKQIKFAKLKNKYIKKCGKYKNKYLLKSVFSYFFSILQLCDDYSSANFSNFIKKYEGNETIFDDVLDNPEEYVLNLKDKKYLNKIFNDFEPYKFQKKLIDNPNKFSLIFAPCGRGKTEASIAWALQIMEKYSKNKIVFAMPTQVTSNAMWERLCEIFDKKNVSLFHGKSYIKLKSGLNNTNEIEEIASETFNGNVFFKPITVTTIDHLIYSFVHGFTQSDFALGNLVNSVIIFDEVHYYEEKTLNNLYTLFNILKAMNIPHNLMSGTLPDFLINSLSEDYKLVTDDEGLNYAPFSISYNKNCLIKTSTPFEIDEKILEDIKNSFNKGLKQFFIFNTVHRAQLFFNKLKSYFEDDNIVLYHSQFTYTDRVNKENEILSLHEKKGSFILIATQVIEISLDISADIMYTELAPPDSIGQRGGRLNRKHDSSNFYEMKIFDPENNLPYDESIINLSRKYLKRGFNSYKDIKNWCDKVYCNKTLKEEHNLYKFFNDSTLFGNKPSNVAFSDESGNKLEIREESIQKIDVVPLDIYQNNSDNLIVENQVKVPLWWIKNDEKENCDDSRLFYNEILTFKDKKRYFIISQMEYSYEYGFNKEKKSNFKEEDNIN